jgi:hypothetical protein
LILERALFKANSFYIKSTIKECALLYGATFIVTGFATVAKSHVGNMSGDNQKGANGDSEWFILVTKDVFIPVY